VRIIGSDSPLPLERAQSMPPQWWHAAMTTRQRPLRMQLQFLGATGTVTGSRYLLTHQGRQLLIDCGLFQGLKQLRLRNWADPPVKVSEIDAVLLTHAHIDHSGYLPRLAQLGFKGRVLCTQGTLDLCQLMLPDAGRLQEEEAEYDNRHGHSKHHPALPLYTEQQARAVLQRFEAVPFDDAFLPWPGWTVRLRPAGHILGAASAHVSGAGRSILFSGDLGRDDSLVMRPPAPPDPADWLVIESTYGDRVHPQADALTRLAEVVNRTAARGGVVLIPSFAVGRTQTLLYAVHLLKQAHRIPDLPVYLNSPMATDATRIYQHHAGEHRLDTAQCEAMCKAAKFVNTVEESKRLNNLRWPSVIISASGMATGGRVLHHLRAYAPDPRNTILFAGYQAAGTRGASIVGGAAQVKIFGEYVPIRAEVAQLDMLSAHADREQLLAWAGRMPGRPKGVFVTHGEPVAADALRLALQERLGWDARVPEYRDEVSL
jgi:metallo-beta-lactamase family protein